MTTYAIGDVQGCDAELGNLLDIVGFNRGKDDLILLGDVVNRGPASLTTLERLYHLQDSVQCVLGNHDIHLLAIYYGKQKPRIYDTFDDVLKSPRCKILLSWMCHWPLVIERGACIFVHAGLHPYWQISEALDYSNQFTQYLLNNPRQLPHIYGNVPNVWDAALSEIERLRLIINITTRMRILHTEGLALDFAYKGLYANIPQSYRAWFDSFPATTLNAPSKRIVFGHWSALGLMSHPNYLSLDTGCAAGGHLTLWQLPSNTAMTTADYIVQQPCLSARTAKF